MFERGRQVAPFLCRSTWIVSGRQAARDDRLAAARDADHGLQILSFEQAAVRLAGGFTRPVDNEAPRTAVQAALPATDMGELESIKDLPGMVGAAVDTLHKAWRAGVELGARAAEHPRLSALARLEAAVLGQLPNGMMRPQDIVAAAAARLHHAPAVLGSMEIVGHTELPPAGGRCSRSSRNISLFAGWLGREAFLNGWRDLASWSIQARQRHSGSTR